VTEKPTRHILTLSGGKDSTALALYVAAKYPDLPVEYVFCDTHKELPETYEYLTKIEAVLGKPIMRLSSEHGDRGFDHFLKLYGGYLPSPGMRWCTRMLKIEPFENYVGEDSVVLYVGIRADENRSGYISTKPNITTRFPFKEDGIRHSDVLRILEDAGLGLPAYYAWRSRSGCYFCFFQRRDEWVGLRERHPDLYELSKTYEKPEEGYTWAQGESLIDIEDPVRVAEIKRKSAERAERDSHRRPRTLAEVFEGTAAQDAGADDADGCTICHI
jgi:phosphoadenosine phosphosulfate reductase family protein